MTESLRTKPLTGRGGRMTAGVWEGLEAAALSPAPAGHPSVVPRPFGPRPSIPREAVTAPCSFGSPHSSHLPFHRDAQSHVLSAPCFWGSPGRAG